MTRVPACAARWMLLVFLLLGHGSLSTADPGRAAGDAPPWYLAHAKLTLRVPTTNLPEGPRRALTRMLEGAGYVCVHPAGPGTSPNEAETQIPQAARRSIRRDAAALLAGAGQFPEGYVPSRGPGYTGPSTPLTPAAQAAFETLIGTKVDEVTKRLERALDALVGERQR